MKITKEDIGRKVWCKEYGEGIIFAFLEDDQYPVKVGFPDGEWENYTNKGKYNDLELSFYPPKTKKRYYQWMINDPCRGWEKTNIYYNENGFSTTGYLFTTFSNEQRWYELEKIKCEDDFIEL